MPAMKMRYKSLYMIMTEHYKIIWKPSFKWWDHEREVDHWQYSADTGSRWKM